MWRISPVVRQFLAIACFNLLTFSFGNSAGWGMINFVELQQNKTTYQTGPFTLREVTFVATSSCIGGIVGNFAVLPMSRRLGHAGTLCLMGVPLIISYLLLIFAQNKNYVYIARVLSGLSGGVPIVSIPSIVAEISFDNVRGTLNSIYEPAYNIGIAVTFILGNFFEPVDQAKILLPIPILFVIVAFFMPQTPEYWIRKNNQERARKSLRFYKGEEEVSDTESLLSADNEFQESSTDSITFSDFMTREAKKSLLIASVLITLCLLVGNGIILDFETEIFVETGSSLSSAKSSVIVIVVKVIANLLVLYVVDHFDRRVLLMTSSIATAIAYAAFGIYCMFYLHTPCLGWLPPFFLATITFAGCAGVLPISYIIINEIFPAKIRTACIAIIVGLAYHNYFVIASLFPIVLQQYGLYACVFIFGSFSTILTFYTYYFLPETRGKSYDEIMAILRT